MPSYDEEDMADAIQDVKEGLSLRQASAKWGIPHTSIKYRKDGRLPVGGVQPAQRLTPAQEKRVCEWILAQESLGFAPRASPVRLVVTGMLKEGGIRSHWAENGWKASRNETLRSTPRLAERRSPRDSTDSLINLLISISTYLSSFRGLTRS